MYERYATSVLPTNACMTGYCIVQGEKWMEQVQEGVKDVVG